VGFAAGLPEFKYAISSKLAGLVRYVHILAFFQSNCFRNF
jgi:hypothetical protein